jgi:hypothetical protein
MELDAVSGLSNLVGSCSTNNDTATQQEIDSCHQGYKMLLTNKLKNVYKDMKIRIITLLRVAMLIRRIDVLQNILYLPSLLRL